MYNVGTVTTTANSTKLIGVGTKWKENINLVLPMQMIQIQIGNTVHNNSIHSIQSNTELTLNFPIPTAQTGAKYVIFTTTMDSISAAANAIVAMNSSNVQFSDIQNRIMTESGVIDVKLPDGTVRKTRTEAERDKLLDGKFDKAGGTISGDVTFSKNAIKSTKGTHTLPAESGTLMQVGDYGVGVSLTQSSENYTSTKLGCGFYAMPGHATNNPWGGNGFAYVINARAEGYGFQIGKTTGNKSLSFRTLDNGEFSPISVLYSTLNTTKDSNGNLKAASPIVKVFADHIETNEESEGVEMERLGIGHYLIKGVVGFNSDGAWGINNGFVIPQDHNGKNMVLIDYKVRPDGDIEVFVFHQQNTDLPERFQNKRIKYIDKDGNPVYYENYEPCDVPESRWIDMRVEMPSNSIYNLKQAEAERLAKEEADRQAEEEAKNAEIEAEEDI
ncbi:TPA: cell envelope integrity protein TolA [Providencia stuartii]|uniref:phage tail fiber protein n=1 Tax=Providencia stuartii TaxID=588 RepID=UPI00197F1618|nr:cell envelope integrity protein TolA [Providencia stuartii]MBN5557320.1 cell envelope integrity protein TolA [Providencia stuartii]HEM8263969.1 cell envelope integrity protein TolA [Providencia stuartii]HEM8283987.1 cell envelope integrity protein TolA [Providencia stuartii]